jgi:PAS domain S-box-containing protein
MVNDKTEALFRFQPHELVGHHIEVLLPDRLRYLHAQHRSRFFADPQTRSMGQDKELAGRRKDGTEFPIEVGLTAVKANGSVVAVAFISDISLRKGFEDEVRLLLEVTRVVDVAEDFESALGLAVMNFCESMGWDFGQAWVPNAERQVLECSSAWWTRSAVLESFRKPSQEVEFPPGAGLLGRVWVSKRPEWVEDVSAAREEAVLLRVGFSSKVDVKSALGLPVISGDNVIAVIELFATEGRHEEKHVIDLALAVGAQLGWVFERITSRQALLAAREELEAKVEHQLQRGNDYGLTFRELTVLHLVAQGKADKEIALELGISPLTAQKHLSNILNKMKATSRTEAGVRAVREGLAGD